MLATPWILGQPAQTRYRLFCLPYAGGGASIYRSWSRYLPGQVEVCPIQLPGHENRFGERPFTQLSALLQELVPAITPYLDVPFQIFGHSMGALTSFELTRALRRQGLPQPTQLFVSGHRAPNLPRTRQTLHQLPDSEFLDRIKKMGGTPEAVLQNRELMDLFQPMLRADFELVETYHYHEEPPLSIPIATFGGLADSDVSREELTAWQGQTDHAFTMKMYPGGHFYLHTQQQELLQQIASYYQANA